MLKILAFLLLSVGLVAQDITGFWMTMDDRTHRPSSVIAIYPYKGRYFGRIIGSFNREGELQDTIYNPLNRTPGIAGNPYYSGLDIVWTGPRKGNKYHGYVMDPRNGKVYDAELWRENGNLVLRGKVLIFGKNVIWPPFPEENFTKEFEKPDISTFVPRLYSGRR